MSAREFKEAAKRAREYLHRNCVKHADAEKLCEALEKVTLGLPQKHGELEKALAAFREKYPKESK